VRNTASKSCAVRCMLAGERALGLIPGSDPLRLL
jgi:hypothetical protein